MKHSCVNLLSLSVFLSLLMAVNGCQQTEEQKSGEYAPERNNAELSATDLHFSNDLLDSIELTEIEAESAEIQNPDHIHVLVNDDHVLPDSYTPDDLTVPDVRFSFDEELDRRLMREEAAEALEQLFRAADAAEQELFAVSGYRSYERQEQLFTAAVNEHGEETARETSAAPGSSEHQTGLAMDVSSRSNDLLLNTDFADTDEGQWVEEHAHEHGFVIRYPEGEEDLTGITFEPWHLRYVGEDAAEELDNSGLTLEELIEKTREYQDGPG
ncbi:M15 family metallopeptidase [Salisediminibacterium halotolerans]|uniref:D-alanyl-D-alanine carboxypeptidase n=1 Tax=Salisediminibacterium halotolerans TaxID=517425 RepID=A0A1H9UMQ6_9BACI|nr:M15 family metallopeptidase [Salisediminibacterium haloalkalitolerans]SES10598.1 D-alanyl-D-alanine carboxypeptidase [Salisediminibacterium haloalkalitolerans]